MKTKQQIIAIYSHDYRNMDLDQPELEKMLNDFLEEIEEVEEPNKYKYSRKQLSQVFADGYSISKAEILDKMILAKESKEEESQRTMMEQVCEHHYEYANSFKCSKCGEVSDGTTTSKSPPTQTTKPEQCVGCKRYGNDNCNYLDCASTEWSEFEETTKHLDKPFTKKDYKKLEKTLDDMAGHEPTGILSNITGIPLNTPIMFKKQNGRIGYGKIQSNTKSKHLDKLVVPTKINLDGITGNIDDYRIELKINEIIDYLISLQKEK
jgi:hypothetical protein